MEGKFPNKEGEAERDTKRIEILISAGKNVVVGGQPLLSAEEEAQLRLLSFAEAELHVWSKFITPETEAEFLEEWYLAVRMAKEGQT
jgi:hypothetical protein